MTIEINEGNKLVAEFMGYCVYSDDAYFKAAAMSHIYQRHVKKYNDNWNDLMLVAEKIHLHNSVKEFVITPGRTRIWMKNHEPNTYIQSPCLPTNNSITECWMAVIEFIIWHNSKQGK